MFRNQPGYKRRVHGRFTRRLLAATALVAAGVWSSAADPGRLYEENPLSSMGRRIEQWRQTEAYVAAQESASASTNRSARASTRPAAGHGDVLAGTPSRYPDRARFRRQIGYPPPGFLAESGLRLDEIGTDETATYYRCHIQVTPEMEACGLYLVPRPKTRPQRSGAMPPCHAFLPERRRAVPSAAPGTPLPLIIAQHGGGGYPELATFHGGSNYHDLVRGAVEQGWAVFAPQLLFYPFGDRDHGTPIPSDIRARLDTRLRGLGTSLAAVEVAKITAALDALLQRPELDPDRVGMVGLSYGGFYTLYTAALDPRIRAAASSCAFADWGTPTEDVGEPGEWFSGGVLNDLTPAALAAMICPRPLLVQAGVHDTLFRIDATREMVVAAADAYERLGGSGRLEFVEFVGGHEFRGEPVWAFFRRSLAAR